MTFFFDIAVVSVKLVCFKYIFDALFKRKVRYHVYEFSNELIKNKCGCASLYHNNLLLDTWEYVDVSLRG